MVNPASVPTGLSKVRREREEENAGVDVPSKKSRKAGQSGVPEPTPEAGNQIASGKGEDENNGTLEENAEGAPQENAEISHKSDPASVEPSAIPTATPEAATRPEAPTQEVYRIPSYAGA